jgi:hypothetical protein
MNLEVVETGSVGVCAVMSLFELPGGGHFPLNGFHRSSAFGLCVLYLF